MLERTDGPFSIVAPIVGATVTTGLSEPCSSDTLDDLASRILTRDRTLQEGARTYWLQNGRDLLQAKALAGHGSFETWCRNKLSYSKSKAEKLMRAAEMFGPLLESRNVTDLPPPTLFYILSAPSVPQVIRDEYTPRILAKEKRVASELKAAIEHHRKDGEQAEGRAARSPDAQVERKAAGGRNEARNAEQCQAEQQRQVAARAAALALVSARLGDDLPMLLALVAEAGVQNVFSYDTERELQARARAQATFTKTGVVTDEREAADPQAVTTHTVDNDGKSVPPSFIKAAGEEREAAPPPVETVSASTSAAAETISLPLSNIRFGRAKRPMLFQSRSRFPPV